MRNKLILFLSLWMMAGLYAMGATAAPFGTYTLGNHCCGAAGGGTYGLRIDLLEGPALDPHTFSMDASDGASVMMEILNIDSDPNTAKIVISGTVVSNQTGFDYAIDFMYNEAELAADGKWVVSVPNGGTGTLKNLTSNVTFDLTGVANTSGDIFFLGLNHRTQPGISGWGWVGADGVPKDHYQDWLFTATPVPEPATLLLIGTGLLGGAAFRKRLT